VWSWLSPSCPSLPLFDEVRHLFYLTNDLDTSADELVFMANERCAQEQLIDQLKNGVLAMRMPVGTLVSNWAYMVMASLAWTLKAWFALMLPEEFSKVDSERGRNAPARNHPRREHREESERTTSRPRARERGTSGTVVSPREHWC
jgi:hypothetical protein